MNVVSKKIPLVVYGGHWVDLMIGESVPQIQQFITRKFGIEWSDMDASASGRYLWINHPGHGNRFFVMITPDANTEVISHEAFHVVVAVFEAFGVKYGYKNDEHFAYLLGYIVKQIHKHLNKYHESCAKKPGEGNIPVENIPALEEEQPQVPAQEPRSHQPDA